MKQRLPLLLGILLAACPLLRQAPPEPARRLAARPAPTAEAAPLPAVPEFPETPEAAVTIASTPPEIPEPGPLTRDPVNNALVHLMKVQNLDGSWGDSPASLQGHLVGRVGTTGLAVLAMLGSNHSHLSKDTYDGYCSGDTLRAALDFLIQGQLPDGTLGGTLDRELEQAIGAFALSEAYGLTGSPRFRSPAQSALDALGALQSPDGSWGTPACSAWASRALVSARISELWIAEETFSAHRRHALDRCERGPDAAAGMFLNFSERCITAYSRASALSIAARPPSLDALDALYFDSWALFHADGPGGALWKPWSAEMARSLRSTQSPTGAFPGGTRTHAILQTSLAALVLQSYWRPGPGVFVSSQQ